METRKASDLQNMGFPKVGTSIIDNMHHIVIISCTITMIIMVIIIVIIVWMMVIIGDFERPIMGRQGTSLEGVVCEGNINLCSSICYWCLMMWWWLFDDDDDTWWLYADQWLQGDAFYSESTCLIYRIWSVRAIIVWYNYHHPCISITLL